MCLFGGLRQVFRERGGGGAAVTCLLGCLLVHVIARKVRLPHCGPVSVLNSPTSSTRNFSLGDVRENSAGDLHVSVGDVWAA